MREQPHFAGEGVLEVFQIPEDDPLKEYRIIKADQWEKFPPGVLDKLIMGGYLVRESKLSGQYLFHRRMCGLQTESADLFEVARSISHDVTDVPDKTVREVVESFCERYRGQPWLMKNKSLTEDLYPESIVRIMAEADPLKVDIDLPYLKRFKRRLPPDTPYQRDLRELNVWFDDNIESILQDGGYNMPPQAVIADDDIILLCIEDDVYSDCSLIVTDDKRMCRRAAVCFPEKIIMRISCHDWVFHSADSERILGLLEDLLGRKPSLRIDFGSLDTFNDMTGATYSMGIPSTSPLIRNWSEDVPRRPPSSQSSIWSRFRVRPKINSRTLLSCVEVITHRNARTMDRLRLTPQREGLEPSVNSLVIPDKTGAQ
jgi:hypothetical protein